MTAEEMEVESMEVMEDSGSTSSSEGEGSTGEAERESDGQEEMQGCDEDEEKAANPEFSKFMQGFWDLASVDVPVRVGAAAMIVRHVSNPEGGDAEYAVKRLVRGMCSSRECARQGFASCLAQVLAVLPKDAPTTPAVLEQILKTTQTTAAMKGADERELALGRLLGVSALAMSGRLGSEPESAEGALKAVSELYTKRKWIGQAAGEAALLVTSKAFEGEGEFLRVVLPLMVPLLKGKDGGTLQLADLSSDQLLLSLGLRSIMRERGLDPQEDAALKQALPAFLRHASVVRVGKAQDLVSPLKQSAGVFPKVHSVWGRLWDDLGLSPAGQPRASLSAKRLKKLGEVWSCVVDGALTNTSLNNKGTAVILLKQVLQRVPAAGVWHVLSPGIVRLILNHTKGEENYLFSLVHMTLKQLPKIIKDDQEVQAQVAACLLRRGTIRFDNRTGVNVVSSLVKGMGQEALDAHVEFLKGVVQGKPGWAGSEDPVANGVATSEEPTDGSGSDAGSAAERLQAVEALYSLARSSGGDDGGRGKRDARGAAIVAAAGGGGGLEIQGKRLTKTAEFFLETGFFAPADGAAATAMPPKTLELCRSKFFSLVADIAAKPLFWQTNSGTNKGESKSKSSKSPSKKTPTDEGASAGWGALEALWGLHETWQGLEGGGRKLVKGLSVGVDDREACSVALAVVGRIRAGAARDDKLGSAFAGILLMVSLHMLEGSNEGARGREMERSQHITDLVETYGRMSGSAKDVEDGDDDEEEEDRDEPDPLAMLADVLVAVVAEPSSHSVRGLRDTARRVWGMVCGSTPLTRSALNTLVAAVCGDQDEGGNESSSEEEEEDSDGDDDEEMAKNGKAGTEGKDSSDGEQEESSSDDSDSDSDENDGDKDEVMVDPSDMEALLGGGDEDEDGEEGFQHHAGADKALGALIGLKKSGRKKGAQEAERQGYQIRLRALDLLEVVCSRRSDSQHLLTALLPVLKTIERLSGVATGGEGSALNIRLQGLYKNRLCKCKPRASSSSSSSSEERGSKPGDDADDTRAQTAEAFSELIGLCRAWEKKNSPLASLALEGALCCLRSLKSSPAKGKGGGGGGGGGGDALEGALKALATAVGDFFGKKRGGGFTVVQVEEVVKRFPDVLSPVLVKAAQGAAASDFLRTEAFSLLAGVLQRRGSVNPASRESLLAQCPAIFKALSDVMSIAAKEAASSAATAATGDAAETGDKKPAKANAASSSAMLKAKRLKPILGCLSATVSADEGVGALSALASEARSLKASLAAVGEASASLAMQLQCGQVAQALDAIAAAGGKEENGAAEPVSEEGGSKKKKKMDKSSPKRKAAAEVDITPDTEVDSPVATAAADVDESKLKSSSSSKKKKKKRRESKEG
ncbi:unnamed protein product [Ectocarpus sp. 12 AP-2014]